MALNPNGDNTITQLEEVQLDPANPGLIAPANSHLTHSESTNSNSTKNDPTDDSSDTEINDPGMPNPGSNPDPIDPDITDPAIIEPEDIYPDDDSDLDDEIDPDLDPESVPVPPDTERRDITHQDADANTLVQTWCQNDIQIFKIQPCQI